MKRTGIKADPEKAREWEERSRKPLKRTAISRNGGRLKQGGSSLKQRSISPASKAQRELAAMAATCTGCGRERAEWLALDPAHLCARGKGGCGHELCTPFALCRTFDGSGCHREFDEGRLDMLKVVNAAPDHYRPALQHALEHMNVVELVERLAGTRIRWADLEDGAG